MKIGKVWGTTELLLATPLIEVHRLVVLPRARCSLHMHRCKWNGFFVATGALSIEVHKNDYALVDVTSLKASEFTTVAPGEFHRFMTSEEGATAIELYYPAELAEDIERKDVGALLVSKAG